MDAPRFDSLTRRWATRRTTLGGLLGGGLGVIFGGSISDGLAKPKKKKKKHKKKKPKGCAAGTITCGSACVNIQTDAEHCGGCGNRCGSAVACVNGQCQGGGCPANQILCGELCVDPTNNERACGGCGNQCNGDLTCLNGTCGCTTGSACGNACFDLQSDDEHCGQCGRACANNELCQSGQCVQTACGANQIDCGDGRCIPDHEHACCDQGDCGGPVDGFNHIFCDETVNRCRCVTTSHGICTRTDDGRGICRACCPGGAGDLNCQGELGCHGFDSCSCPAGKSQCPGENRCYQDPPNPDFTLDDPTHCLNAGGTSCMDCTLGGTKPYMCCLNRFCFDTSGLEPGMGSSFGAMCGSCARCPENKVCCNDGPGTPPKCKNPAGGGVCPNAGTG